MMMSARGGKTEFCGPIAETVLGFVLACVLSVGTTACGADQPSLEDARDGGSAQGEVDKCSEAQKQECFDEYVRDVERCEHEMGLGLRASMCREKALVSFEECLAHANCPPVPKK